MFNHFNKFDSFNHFSIKLNKEAVYNPFINYTWEMLPNAKVKNSGTSGVDLQLYSGNPMDFQATQGVQVNKSFTLSGNAISLYLGFDTDSIAITHTLAEFDNLKVSIVNAILRVTINSVNHDVATLVKDTYYQTEIVINSNNLTVKLNGTQTYSASCTALNTTILKSLGANDGLASGRFDGQLDYFIVYNGLTTFSLSNQFFKNMSTDVNTLFCTDFGGNSGYIADSKNVSVGSELVGGNTYVIKAGSPTITDMGDYILIEGKTTTDYVEVTGTQRPYIEANSTTLWSFEIDNTIGSAYVRAFQGDAYKPLSTYGGAGYEKGTSIISNTNGIGGALIFVQPTTAPYAIKAYNISAKQLLAVYPITNYSATQRTNFTQVNKGLQDLTRSFDSNGFFVDNVSYLNCNGKGYGDTGWMPSADGDWSIECVINNTNSGLQAFGSSDGIAGATVLIGFNSSFLYTNIAGKLNTYKNLGYGTRLITVCYQKDADNYLVYVDGLYNQTVALLGAYTGSTLNFLLGARSKNTSNISTKGINKLFKVHNKVLTQEEITKNYNSYVAQGLLS